MLEEYIAKQDLPIEVLGASGMVSVVDLVQHIACGIVTCAAMPPYLITHINAIAAEWVNGEPHSLIGQPLVTTMPGNGGEWLDAISRTIATGTSVRLDGLTARWPDDKVRGMTIICLPVPERDGAAITQVLSLLIDTPSTALVPTSSAATDSPRSELRRLEDALISIPIPLWLFDMRGRVRFVNEATLRLFRVDTFDQFVALVGLTIPEQAARLRPRMTSPTTIADVTEKSFSTRNLDRLGADGAETLWASDRRREEAEQLTHGELAISRALGRRRVTNQIISMVHPTLETEIIVRAAAAPIVNQTGRPIGAYYITEDVTEEMLLHGQRDAMLAIAGHDLRNPLTPAKLLLQQLQRKLTRAGGFDRELGDIDRVMEQLQRIQQIANDLDAVSATARGDILDLPRSCDLTALCQAAAQTQMQRHPEVRVHVQSIPTPIVGGWGRRHIEQVLAMLVASAARRTPAGRSVNIRLKQLRNRVRVEIADQGEPMAPERLEAWNQVLSRGGAVLAFADGGDLDLSVVQTLLSLYRSKLQVGVKPHQGTTFWFMLPLPAEQQGDG